MIVDDYHYEPPATLSVEVYDDQNAEDFVAEVGDRLRLVFGSGGCLYCFSNPKSNRALGGLSDEEERLLRAMGCSDGGLEITVAARDADHEHDCNRYLVRISAVDNNERRGRLS